MSIENHLNSKSQINEAWEVVGVYEMHIEGLEQKLKVKVLKMLSADSPTYMGVTNLEITGKDCATPYRSLNPSRTAEEAFKDAIDGFFVFFEEGAHVQEVEDW